MTSSSVSLRAGWADARTSTPPSDPSPGASGEQESWAERFYAALPLFIVGGVCVGMALDLHSAGPGTSFGGDGSVALRPWILFLALGITGVCAGVVALFAKDPFADTLEAKDGVPLHRPAPDWDESLLEPEPATVRRRRTWEISGYSLEDSASGPTSSDGALDQIDEIEEALRKKPEPPVSE